MMAAKELPDLHFDCGDKLQLPPELCASLFKNDNSKSDEVPEDIKAFFGHPLTAATTAINGEDTHASALALLHEYQNLPAIDRSDMKIGDKFETLSDILKSDDKSDGGTATNNNNSEYMMLLTTDVDEFLNRDCQPQDLSCKDDDDQDMQDKGLDTTDDSMPDDLLLPHDHDDPMENGDASASMDDFVHFEDHEESLSLTTDIKQEVLSDQDPCEHNPLEILERDKQLNRNSDLHSPAQDGPPVLDGPEPLPLVTHPPPPRYEDLPQRQPPAHPQPPTIVQGNPPLQQPIQQSSQAADLQAAPSQDEVITVKPKVESQKPSENTKRIIQALTEKIRRNQMQRQNSEHESNNQVSINDINDIISESIDSDDPKSSKDNSPKKEALLKELNRELPPAHETQLQQPSSASREVPTSLPVTTTSVSDAKLNATVMSPLTPKLWTAPSPLAASPVQNWHSPTTMAEIVNSGVAVTGQAVVTPVPSSPITTQVVAPVANATVPYRAAAPVVPYQHQTQQPQPQPPPQHQPQSQPQAQHLHQPQHQTQHHHHQIQQSHHQATAGTYYPEVYTNNNYGQYPRQLVAQRPLGPPVEGQSVNMVENYIQQNHQGQYAPHGFVQGQSANSYTDLKSPDSGYNESCISPTGSNTPVFNESGSSVEQSSTNSEISTSQKIGKRRRSSVNPAKHICANSSTPSKLSSSNTYIPKLENDLSGYKYHLETCISTSQRIDEDRITYLNKGQFYGLTLEHRPTSRILTCNTVKSIIVVLFREERLVGEELKAWEFWHSRQHSSKQRILDIDTKNSSGILQNCIDEIAHNAVAIRWNPREQPARVNIAINCLSTDFSNQKGVKGLPLHVHIDTYEDAKDPTPVHRGYCQVKVFCDKGAERKTRDEERRKDAKVKPGPAEGRQTHVRKKAEDIYHPPCDRSEFYTMADLTKQPVLFNPVPEYEDYNHKLIKTEPSSFDIPSTPSFDSDLEGLDSSTDDMSHPAKRFKRENSLNSFTKDIQRVLLYVREGHEIVFTALLLQTPTLAGLSHAVEEKYNIPAAKIKNVFKRSRKGILVKMDDNIIRHYSNESTFIICIKKNEETHESQLNYDVTLTEIDTESQ